MGAKLVQKKMRFVTSISINEEDVFWWKEMKRLAALEGVSLSQLIVRAIKEYMEKHGEGNPQLTLTGRRIRPFRFKSVEARRELLEDLEYVISCNPGILEPTLVAAFGRKWGLREQTVREYVRQLLRAGRVQLRGNKLYLKDI